MSQSPLELGPHSAAQLGDYRQGWRDLYGLLKAGKSFSGRERNCCFLNLESKSRFADVSAAVGFDHADDGRALALVDWDNDGDLDIWLANRTAPRLRFLRNDCGSADRSLELKLIGTSCNRDAIGARVELHLKNLSPNDSAVRKLIRTVRAGDAFLSQSSKTVHFGLGTKDRIDKLVVAWPGGDREVFHIGEPVAADYSIVQGAGKLSPSKRTRSVELMGAKLPDEKLLPTSRSLVCGRIPLPEFSFRDTRGSQKSLEVRNPTLINLWASWCQPCIRELTDWADAKERFREAGLDVLALCVDGIARRDAEGKPNASQTLEVIELPFSTGHATQETLASLELMQSTLFDDARPCPVPSSFLLDDQGCIVAIYRGPVEPEQVLDDLDLVQAAPREIRDANTRFAGRWLSDPPPPRPMRLAHSLERDDPNAAAGYLRRVIALHVSEKHREYWSNETALADAHLALATIELRLGNATSAIANLQQSVKHNPNNFSSQANLGSAFFRSRQWQKAEQAFSSALKIRPDNVSVLVNRGLARQRLNRIPDAIVDFSLAVELEPNNVRARYNLARCEAQVGNDRSAVAHLERLVTSHRKLLEAKNDLAWLLATSKDPLVRNAPQALNWPVSFAGTLNRRTP